MTKSTASKPVPLRDANSSQFFDGARRGQLMLQHCTKCSRHSLQGGRYCPNCLAELSWVSASGRAELFTFTRVYQKSHPGFAEDIPYLVAVGRTQEGPLLALRLLGVEQARVGDTLEVHFIENDDAEPTPVFRLASG